MVRYTLRSSFLLCVSMKKSTFGVKIAIFTRSFKIFIYFLKLCTEFLLNMSESIQEANIGKDRPVGALCSTFEENDKW